MHKSAFNYNLNFNVLWQTVPKTISSSSQQLRRKRWVSDNLQQQTADFIKDYSYTKVMNNSFWF